MIFRENIKIYTKERFITLRLKNSQKTKGSFSSSDFQTTHNSVRPENPQFFSITDLLCFEFCLMSTLKYSNTTLQNFFIKINHIALLDIVCNVRSKSTKSKFSGDLYTTVCYNINLNNARVKFLFTPNMI